MSRQIESLNRFLFYPSNLQSHSPNISIADLAPSPVPSCTNKSPSMDSNDTSTHTVFHTISQFNNSCIETPDAFRSSESSPSTSSQTQFRPLHTQTPDEPSPAPSFYTDATTILSSMTSHPPNPLAPLMKKLKKNLIIS